MSEGRLQQPPDPPRRVSRRLGSRDRVTWAHGGVPRQVTPTSPPGQAQAGPSQAGKQPGHAASPAQAAGQPDPASNSQLLNKQPAPRRKSTRPVRPTGVQQMTDSESEMEESMPSDASAMAGQKRTATQANRPGNRPGNKKQAADRPAQPDSDEECIMAAQTTDRSGQPSSHKPGEASGSGQLDSRTDSAAGTQQQRGKRRLRTAGGKLVGKGKPATAAHAAPTAAGKSRNAVARQPSNRGRSSFSFDRTPEAEDGEASLSDPDAPTRRAT